MALETGFGGSARINNRAGRAAALHVQTSRSMTRFAADIFGVVSLCLQTRMRGRAKIARDVFMTRLATFRSDKLRAGNTRRRHEWRDSIRSCCRKAELRSAQRLHQPPNRPFHAFRGPIELISNATRERVLSKAARVDYAFLRKIFRSYCATEPPYLVTLLAVFLSRSKRAIFQVAPRRDY